MSCETIITCPTDDPPPIPYPDGWSWTFYTAPPITYRHGRHGRLHVRLSLPDIGIDFGVHRSGYRYFGWHIYMLGFRAYGSYRRHDKRRIDANTAELEALHATQ